MAEGTITYGVEGHIARLAIAQERRRNALSLAMWKALPDLMARAAEDANVRLVVISGAGRIAFSSGADISEFATVRSTPREVEAYEQAVGAAMDAVLRHPKPVIAAIRGICFGGGMEVAMCCDLRLADEAARFRMPGAQLGLGYAYDAVALLKERLGAAATSDILFSGREIAASEALALGVVQKVFASDEFETRTSAYQQRIARNAPLTLVAVKRALIELAKPHGKADRAAIDKLVAACFASRDYEEGRTAFREKREPLFGADAGTAAGRDSSTLGER